MLSHSALREPNGRSAETMRPTVYHVQLTLKLVMYSVYDRISFKENRLHCV